MQPQAPSPPPDGRGLPPILPPSGTHVFKMFVVPLLIVGGLLLGAFVFLRFAGGPVGHSPGEFIRELRSDNPDVRSRAAQVLTQVLTRDEQLASDPHFALDLTAIVPQAVADADRERTSPGETTGSGPSLIDRDLTLARGENFLLYLGACVSHLSTPAAVPLLKPLALDGGPEPAAEQMTRRWRAVWALANLGGNLKRFDALAPERKQAVLSGFEQEASGEGDRAAWAAQALACLKDRTEGKTNSLGVDEVLVKCSTDPNPSLREIAVFALNFWDGPAVEEALVARLDDRGQGDDLLADFAAGDKSRDAQQFTKTPGLRIRYNAAVALARRGSGLVPVDLLGQMLDESEQLDQNRVRSRKDGRESADEATAYDVEITALQAVAELHKKNASVNLTALGSAIDRLKDHSASPAVRKEAEVTRKALSN